MQIKLEKSLMFIMIIWTTEGKLEVEYCDYADQTGKILNVYMIIWTTQGKLEVEYCDYADQTGKILNV